MRLAPVHYKYYLYASFFLKAIYLFLFVHNIRLWEDHTIAVNVVTNGESFINMDGLNNHSFQFPIYPYIISALYYVCGIHPILACFFNLILNTLCGVVLIKLMRELIIYFKLNLSETKINNLSLISLLIFLFHPAINFYTLYNVHPFMQNMLFLMLSLYLSFKYAKQLNYKNSLLFGLLLGLAILDRGTALMTLIPFILIVFINHDFKTTIIHGFIICSIAVLICTPWLIHNYLTDDFVGLASASGKDMYKGVLENSEGSNYLSNGHNYYEALNRHETDSVAQISAGAQSNYYMHKVFMKWKEEPQFVIKMFFLKLKNFWWFRSQAGSEQSERVHQFIPIYKSIYFILLLCVAVSFIFIGRRVLTLLSVPMAISLLQAAFYVETRHRIIIEPLLIFVAITTIALIIERRTFSKAQRARV